jgi:predicted nucleic acid-binding protein
MPRFVDANVFLRLLLDDHPTWSPACKRLFLAVEQGDEEVWTSDIVLSEVVYVLASVYKVSRHDIATKIPLLLRLRGLRLPNKRLYARVFRLYTTTNLSYADCHTAALIELRGERQIYSYDQGFGKVPTLERLEP